MPTVVDTVVLHYFLVVDRAELLLELLDPPVGIPRIVFDPDDDDGRDIGVSELRRNIRYEQRLANEAAPDDGDDLARELEDARASAEANVQRLRHIDDLVAGGRIEVLDLTEEERDMSAQLASREPDPALGLLIALDDGEAACVAVAIERGWTLATDDTDALRVLDRLASNHPYERIRRLLIRGANDGLITEAEANDIHEAMTRAGFWDRTRPFPQP
jgi:predicted nucleic acid-binding protein